MFDAALPAFERGENGRRRWNSQPGEFGSNVRGGVEETEMEPGRYQNYDSRGTGIYFVAVVLIAEVFDVIYEVATSPDCIYATRRRKY